jgi:transcriptional regulator with XRE-family HTH domain
MGKTSDLDPNTHRFGKLNKDLRRVRGFTQEDLAERSGLSADTIRRAEHRSFSPSLKTIGKLARGLDVSFSSLFSAFGLAELDIEREIVRLARRRMTPKERALAPRLLTTIAAFFTAVLVIEDGDSDDQAVRQRSPVPRAPARVCGPARG